MCKLLDIPRSSLYYNRSNKLKKKKTDDQINILNERMKIEISIYINQIINNVKNKEKQF